MTNYPPEKRERILAKVREYQMLPADVRELRLRVTELRWYLLPLLKAPDEQRAELLKSVPEPYRDLIAARLDEWQIWPQDLKAEVLEYESAMRWIASQGAEGVKPGVFESLSGEERLGLEQKLAEWHALPPGQREQTFGGFRHYFELSEAEQRKVLTTLSEPDRQQTAKVVR